MATPQTILPSSSPSTASAFLSPRAELDAAPRVKIRVHKTGDRNEQKYVFVGVNGVNYQIERGKDVDVPFPVMRVLQDAVQTIWEQNDDLGSLERREAQSYPFTLLS